MPPQFTGPKLLTAIHNVVQCPVLESAGMLSPLVIRDITAGGGAALELLQQKSSAPMTAANLCTSMREMGELTDTGLVAVISRLTSDAKTLWCGF